MIDQTMLMILCSEERVDELLEVLDAHPEVTGFTELRDLQGSGTTGRHMGTRAFPGSVSMIFTVGEEAAMRTLAADLGEFAKGCRAGSGLRVFAMKASQLV